MAESITPKQFSVNSIWFQAGVASSDGAQIPSNFLDHAFVLISIRRYGYCDSIILPTDLIRQGVTSLGTIRKYGVNDIQIKISEHGLIIISGTNANELFVSVYAFG